MLNFSVIRNLNGFKKLQALNPKLLAQHQNCIIGPKKWGYWR